MCLMILTKGLVALYGLCRCSFFLRIFLELSNQDPPHSVPLGLHVARFLCTMSSEDLMSFFLGLVDCTQG